MPSVLDGGSGYVFSDNSLRHRRRKNKVAHTTVVRQQQEEVLLQSDIFRSQFSRSKGHAC